MSPSCKLAASLSSRTESCFDNLDLKERTRGRFSAAVKRSFLQAASTWRPAGPGSRFVWGWYTGGTASGASEGLRPCHWICHRVGLSKGAMVLIAIVMSSQVGKHEVIRVRTGTRVRGHNIYVCMTLGEVKNGSAVATTTTRTTTSCVFYIPGFDCTLLSPFLQFPPMSSSLPSPSGSPAQILGLKISPADRTPFASLTALLAAYLSDLCDETDLEDLYLVREFSSCLPSPPSPPQRPQSSASSTW